MKGLLQEDGGGNSSIRLSMFIAVCSGCAVAIIGVVKGTSDLFGLAALAGGLVSAGMGFKALQKNKEKADG